MILYRIVDGFEKRNLEEGYFNVPSTFVRFPNPKSTTFAGEIQKLNNGKFFFCQLSDAIRFYQTINGDSYFLNKPEIYCFEIDDSLITPSDCGIGNYPCKKGSFSNYPVIKVLLENKKLKNINFQRLDNDALSDSMKVLEANEYIPAYKAELVSQFKSCGIDLEYLASNDMLNYLHQKLSIHQIGEIVYSILKKYYNGRYGLYTENVACR